MKFQSLSRARSRSSGQAFSLVEVVLAIGVASFTLLGMVALLPIGLKTAKEAADATTQSQIVQYCRNQLELTPFANLSTAWTSQTLYFDNQGLPTTSTDAEQIYTVKFNVGNVGLSTNGVATVAYLGQNANLNNVADAQLVQVIMINRTLAGTAGSNVFPIVVPNAGF